MPTVLEIKWFMLLEIDTWLPSDNDSWFDIWTDLKKVGQNQISIKFSKWVHHEKPTIDTSWDVLIHQH